MNGRLIGLVKETLTRRYGDGIWSAVAGRELASGGDAASDALVCWLGRQAVPGLSRRYPSLFERHGDLEGFVRGLGDELPSVRVGAEEGSSVTFGFGSAPDGSLLVRIGGEAPICALVQGVIAGAAVHYGQTAALQELKCRKRGDNACVLRVRVTAGEGEGEGGPGRERLRAVGSA